MGVPDSLPESASNEAQAGLFWILKVRDLPAGSDAVGVKVYAVPALTELAGAPLIAGAEGEAGGGELEGG
jgi:hypothetical protein